ncbi:hypothetical protein BC628DRAFT_121708 [Trametes gibbosa]|nr:hypothetical protein BC628DRAFT_121708 [Trametes gibbosa]
MPIPLLPASFTCGTWLERFPLSQQGEEAHAGPSSLTSDCPLCRRRDHLSRPQCLHTLTNTILPPPRPSPLRSSYMLYSPLPQSVSYRQCPSCPRPEPAPLAQLPQSCHALLSPLLSICVSRTPSCRVNASRTVLLVPAQAQAGCVHCTVQYTTWACAAHRCATTHNACFSGAQREACTCPNAAGYQYLLNHSPVAACASYLPN